MSDAPPDPAPILELLGVPESARATPVVGGADTLIWRVEGTERTSALRLFRPEQAAMARREVAAMTAASAAGLSVPLVYAEGIWRGRPALLMSWMPGRPLWDELRAQPWRAWALGVRFGRAQAAVHAVPAPAALFDHPTPWIAWANPDDALRDRLHAAARGPDVLLHLDFHPMNVLVADRRVSAVLDWANTRTGDRRADLARTASILRFAPLDLTPSPLLESVARRALIAGWRRGYREVAGPMEDMAPFYAWAGAVMIRDLTPRLGRPDLPWLTPEYLGRVRCWADGFHAPEPAELLENLLAAHRAVLLSGIGRRSRSHRYDYASRRLATSASVAFRGCRMGLGRGDDPPLADTRKPPFLVSGTIRRVIGRPFTP